MAEGNFLNEQVVVANFSSITAAGTYSPAVETVVPAGATITDLIVVENTALAGGTSYKFFVDSITGSTDTDLTGAVSLATFTGLNSLMLTATTGVEATMTTTTKVAETGHLKMTTVGTTSAGDIDVIVKFVI